MNWASNLPPRRSRAWVGLRISAPVDGASARFRQSETAPAILQMRGGVMSPSDGFGRILIPALAPHPTRREASSGVFSFLTCSVEPASVVVPRSP